MRIGVGPLEDRFVRLEPFEDGLKAEVRAALDCDPEAWAIMVGSAQGEHFDGWWTAALAAMRAGTRIAYAAQIDTSPPPGIERVDTQTRFTLVYGF